MSTFFDAQNWWDANFSSSLDNNRQLPDPDFMPSFWQKKFPIFSLLSDSITNTDQYWKRIQRIMSQMSFSNNDIPCPFQRLTQFVPAFYYFVQKLDPKSIKQLLIFLECMPKSYDTQTILWNIPSAIKDPQTFLNLLDTLFTTKHWIWNALINCDGGSGLFFDRFLPYITPISDELSKDIKNFHFIVIDIVFSVFMSQPSFPDSFDSLFPNFLRILQKGNPEQSIHCFRLLTNLFKLHCSSFPTESFSTYLKDFSEAAVTNPILKPFVGPFALSLHNHSLSIIFLAQLYLKNSPNQNDILFIENNLMNTQENPNSIILRILSLCITDKIYCSSYLHLLKAVKLLLSSNIPSVSNFVQNIVGFVIIAKSRNSKHRTVSMIFELLKTLSNLGYEWIRNEVSHSAAILLASQEVPLAFVNSLKPSMHCDKSVLIKWQKLASDSSFDIKSLLQETSNLNNASNNKSNNVMTAIATSNNLNDSKCKVNSSCPIHPKPPITGTRSAPMRNPRASQRGKISSFSKTKSREVKKPLVKAPSNKFFQNVRDNQS